MTFEELWPVVSYILEYSGGYLFITTSVSILIGGFVLYVVLKATGFR